jgi:hypothetical protein
MDEGGKMYGDENADGDHVDIGVDDANGKSIPCTS